MKIAITGKGGVGKTTLAAALAKHHTKREFRVLAVDADPDSNLGAALGLSPDALSTIIPLAQMKDLVEERTGAKPGTFGSYFKLNPKVDDVPDKFSYEVNGIKLIVMGTITKGGAGCVCPESALLKALLKHLLLERDEALVLDMEAGLEHLGRATAESVDALVVVVEPDLRSLQTAKAIRKLAKDIGIEKLFVVLNKVQGREEKTKLEERLKDFETLGVVSYSTKIRDAGFENKCAYDIDSSFAKEVENIYQKLEEKLEKRD